MSLSISRSNLRSSLIYEFFDLSDRANYSLTVVMSLNELDCISAFGELGVSIDLFKMGHVRPCS